MLLASWRASTSLSPLPSSLAFKSSSTMSSSYLFWCCSCYRWCSTSSIYLTRVLRVRMMSLSFPSMKCAHFKYAFRGCPWTHTHWTVGKASSLVPLPDIVSRKKKTTQKYYPYQLLGCGQRSKAHNSQVSYHDFTSVLTNVIGSATDGWFWYLMYSLRVTDARWICTWSEECGTWTSTIL